MQQNIVPLTHQERGIPVVYTLLLHLCCSNQYHRLFPTCLQHRPPPYLDVHLYHPSDEQSHLCIHFLLLKVIEHKPKKFTHIVYKWYMMYLCISLQHLHCDHNCEHQLQGWGTLTVLILFQYISHCPRVCIHIHDQSRHWNMQLLLNV